MWLIAGTIPEDDAELSVQSIYAPSHIADGFIILADGRRVPIARGTAALAATAMLASKALNCEPPRLLFAHDKGNGSGSGQAYAWLAQNLPEAAKRLAPLAGVTFHYFYPDLDGHNRLLVTLQNLDPRPCLVADAGFMYVAKMSGYAREYDLFTPDLGELAFLADEKAPHPFYTRGFLLARDDSVEELLKRAQQHDNCPENMIVKGVQDYIVCSGKITARISEPAQAAMECIGGTGDIVTGFATAFLNAGFPVCKSALWAARAARQLALLCRPNPATQVAELIARIPELWEKAKKIILG